MRKLYSLLFILILTSVLNAQWTNQNPVPDGNNLWSAFFVNESTGWIIGSDGFIKKTTNTGLEWNLQNSGTSVTLKSIRFIDLNNGWICGEEGLILKTTDGGDNWQKVTESTSETLTSLDFCSPNIGYIAGYNGTILKTTDSGITWAVQSTSETFDLFSIDFVDALLGYAAGGSLDSVKLLRTTDGGINWTELPIDLDINNLNKIYKVLFLNENIGFIGGGTYNGAKFIFKTTDGGTTWNKCEFIYGLEKQANSTKPFGDVFESGGINSIYFQDFNTGYAVGGFSNGWDRVIYTTSDGGATWVNKYYGSEQDGLLSVCGNNSGKAWAVGFTGSIFLTEDSGASWSQILSGDKSTLWSGDDIYSLFFLDKNNGWAVGKRNTEIPGLGDVILNTTNGGRIWKTQYYNESSDGSVKSVYFYDRYRGWTAGVNGLMKTTDGGNYWYNSGLNGGAVSILFLNENTGIATNDYTDAGVSGIYKTTDGGVNWTRKNETRISDTYFLNLSTGWAVGPDGVLLKTTDGGENWLGFESGVSSGLNSIRFYNNFGACVGDDGTFLLSTDEGATWKLKNSGTIKNLNAVYITDSRDIWAVGDNGTILLSSDLANTWSPFNNLTRNNLTTLFFSDRNNGWIGGLNGTIYKYDNEILPVELITFTAVKANGGILLEWKTATEINNYGFEVERMVDDESWNKIGFIKGHGSTSGTQFYSYIDNHPHNGSVYKYRLKQIDLNGISTYSDEVEIKYLPEGYVLNQNYPNPFNPSTYITYFVPHKSHISLQIFDILGNEIEALLNEVVPAGSYQIEFTADDLPSGIYICRMQSGSFVSVKKMILLK